MLKRFFTENINYKVAAIILAILLKLYFVSPRNQVQDSVIVPIAIVDLPKTLAVISPRNLHSLTATITLNGPRSLVEQYKNNPREIRVPLMYLNQRTHPDESFVEKIDLKQFVNIPSGLELENIEPTILKFTLDKNNKKNVVVDVMNNLVGELQPGYVLKNVTVTPSSMMITGPALELDRITKINTEKIDISPFTESQEFHVLLDTISDLVVYNVDMVKVTLEIVQKTKEKQFSQIPVRVIVEQAEDGADSNKYAKVVVAPTNVRVKIKIREDEYANIKPEDIQLVVDTRILPPGEHLVKPQLKEADKRFTLVETMPATVNVKIK